MHHIDTIQQIEYYDIGDGAGELVAAPIAALPFLAVPPALDPPEAWFSLSPSCALDAERCVVRCVFCQASRRGLGKGGRTSTMEVPSRKRVRKRTLALAKSPSFRLTTMN